MIHPALGQKQLSRFSYHWFWGLRVDKTEDNTCYDDAVYLQENPEIRQKIIDQMNQVGEFLWLVRAVYWVCNIKQYRVNCYKCLSYTSLSIYQAEIKKMSKNKQIEIEQIGGFLVFITASILGGFLFESFRPGVFSPLVNWFRQRLEPFLSNEIKSYSRDIESSRLLSESNSSYDATSYSLVKGILKPTENAKDSDVINTDLINQRNILVTNEIIAEFELLGITANIGDRISLSDLKKSYKKQLLLKHPDKTGLNSTKECQDVMDAYKKIIESNYKKEGANHFWPGSNLYSSAFNERVEQEIMEWKKLRKEIDAFGEGVRVLGEEVHQTHLEVGQLLKDFLMMNARQQEIDAANGLPPLTDEEINGFIQDPDYFNKRKEDMAKKQVIDVSVTEQSTSLSIHRF